MTRIMSAGFEIAEGETLENLENELLAAHTKESLWEMYCRVCANLTLLQLERDRLIHQLRMLQNKEPP